MDFDPRDYDDPTEAEFAQQLPDSDNHSAMTAAGKNIVEDFVNLSDTEKREVLANLLRISVRIDYPQMSDEELLASADAVFLEYDRRETDE